MSAIFNERMTCSEAQRVLFSSVQGKSKDEVDQIKNEYARILPVIAKREREANAGFMTEYVI